MKILQVITGLQKAAGTSVFCGELCNQLVALGHEVAIAVCNPAAPNSYPLDKRVRIVSIESLLHPTPTPTPYTYSLIHIHGLWSPVLHKMSKWAQKRGIGVVWSTHGMTAPWSLHHKWWKKALPWYLYQKGDLKRAVFVHSTVEQEEKWNAALGFKRGVVAPLGTHLPRENISHVEMEKGRKILLFVGRVYPVKAIDRLIESFSRVEMEKGRNWVLRIVGPDQAGHMEELVQLCEKLGITYSLPRDPPHSTSLHFYTANNPCVQFVGPKFDAELDAEYTNCDCLALVSHTENFGATVVDAMAHGKPVITSTATPWKKVGSAGVGSRKCGWWVGNEPEILSKAIAEMMAMSDSERAEMGARGRKLVEEKYTWQAVAKKLEWAYSQAANKCPMAPCVGCENYGDTCPIP